MKILVISHEYPPIGGGGANACFYISKGLADNNNKVTIITSNYKGLGQDEIINGVELIRVNSLRKNTTHSTFIEMFSFLIKAYFRAISLHKNHNFDQSIIFFGIPSGPIGLIIKKRFNLPYIIRMGGGDIPGFQKRYKYLYRVLTPILKLIWREADSLVVNSSGLKKMAEDFYSDNKIDIIHNGVDTDYFTPSTNPKEKQNINILFLSRLIERKGLQFIIPLLPAIIKKSNKNITLTVVGDGPYRDNLVKLTQECKLENIIDFVGHKNSKDTKYYYQNADIFILPSRNEGMPNVVLEAMSCGLPIIMSDCPGSEELVTDNGYIISLEKQEDYINKISTLINDDHLRKTMSQSSRARAETQFSWEKAVEQYVENIGRKTKGYRLKAKG